MALDTLKDKINIVRGISSNDVLLELAKSMGDIYKQADDHSGSGIVSLTSNRDIKKYGFTNQSLFPHTDRSNMLIPPEIVILRCEKKADIGGETLLFDAEEKLLPVLNQVNFSAIFTSENDEVEYKGSLYDAEKEVFHFRADAFIHINQETISMYSKAVEIIKDNTISFDLPEDSAIIIDNRKIFHGRKSFVGDRVIHRVLVNAKK
jgi:alpha-ketoglutarate-dependent taurine dioxygenase